MLCVHFDFFFMSFLRKCMNFLRIATRIFQRMYSPALRTTTRISQRIYSPALRITIRLLKDFLKILKDLSLGF